MNDRDALAAYFPRQPARNQRLEKMLSDVFRAPKPRQPDTQRKYREYAKRVGAEIGCDIEKFRQGGMAVYPPIEISDTPRDPFDGDHYCCDWQEAAQMVKAYEAIVKAGTPT